MTETSPFAPDTLFSIGPVPVSTQVVVTWCIMLALVVASALITSRFSDKPGRGQVILESVVVGIAEQIRGVIGRDATPYLPLLGTFFLYVAAANLTPLIPGVKAPTARLETTAALALMVYVSVHYFGIRSRGLWAYLKGYAHPNILLLPLNIVSEISRSFSLMIRLFGNLMSHELVIAIIITLAGLFVPIPFMALAILIGLIQAYIFTVLATVFLGGAVTGEAT